MTRRQGPRAHRTLVAHARRGGPVRWWTRGCTQPARARLARGSPPRPNRGRGDERARLRRAGDEQPRVRRRARLAGFRRGPRSVPFPGANVVDARTGNPPSASMVRSAGRAHQHHRADHARRATAHGFVALSRRGSWIRWRWHQRVAAARARAPGGDRARSSGFERDPSARGGDQSRVGDTRTGAWARLAYEVPGSTWSSSATHQVVVGHGGRRARHAGGQKGVKPWAASTSFKRASTLASGSSIRAPRA